MAFTSSKKTDGGVEIVISDQRVIDYLLANESNISEAYSGTDLTDLFSRFNKENTKPSRRVKLELSVAIKVCLWCFDRIDRLGSGALRKDTLCAKDEVGRRVKSEMLLYNWAEAFARITDDTFDPKLQEEFIGLKAVLSDFYLNKTMLRVMELRNETIQRLMDGDIQWDAVD